MIAINGCWAGLNGKFINWLWDCLFRLDFILNISTHLKITDQQSTVHSKCETSRLNHFNNIFHPNFYSIFKVIQFQHLFRSAIKSTCYHHCSTPTQHSNVPAFACSKHMLPNCKHFRFTIITIAWLHPFWMWSTNRSASTWHIGAAIKRDADGENMKYEYFSFRKSLLIPFWVLLGVRYSVGGEKFVHPQRTLTATIISWNLARIQFFFRYQSDCWFEVFSWSCTVHNLIG